MSKRPADSTPGENAPKRRKLSDEALVEAASNGDTAAVRTGLEKRSQDTASKIVAFDAVAEGTTMNASHCFFRMPRQRRWASGVLLSECVHADHTARRSSCSIGVCSNVAFVPLWSTVFLVACTKRCEV